MLNYAYVGLKFVSTLKEEEKDQVELQLALKVCRADLTKAQEELNRMKAEYWDVVPRRHWDTLERTHKQTILQVAHIDTYTAHIHVYTECFEMHSNAFKSLKGHIMHLGSLPLLYCVK